MSALLGAELYLDDVPRQVRDETSLPNLVAHLLQRGQTPYVIPGGASEHPLGGLGYAACAAEITSQSRSMDVDFDVIVHCTGSSSTQAGLIAGFNAVGAASRVIGVADDDERETKERRVLRLANATLSQLGLAEEIHPSQVEVVVADRAPYGVASPETVEAIHLLAETEGIVADPVYEGKAMRGLIDLINAGTLVRGQHVLLMHLGGTPAIDAYADGLWSVDLQPVLRSATRP